jgi:hypothetical protein
MNEIQCGRWVSGRWELLKEYLHLTSWRVYLFAAILCNFDFERQYVERKNERRK